ncbi:MAG TPA: LemA family protein [Desulfomonilaceae bacterium]|nr:LemA family protein [Desulfomonilaceae bacterium]
MTLSKVIEICCSILVAFLILVLISFLTMRPVLQEVRLEAGSEWDGFLRSVRDRNEALPGLAEAIRGFEPGHARLAEGLLEARSVSLRSADPVGMVAAVDEIERLLMQIENLTLAKPGLSQYPPFLSQWKKVVTTSRRVAFNRKNYSNAAKVYNRLLMPFPQNILATVFGFVPLENYPVAGTIGDDR